MTKISLPSRIGSGQVNTGFNTQSEFSPGAWLVLDPSNPHIGGFSPNGTILVLDLNFCVGVVPSIQIYSAL